MTIGRNSHVVARANAGIAMPESREANRLGQTLAFALPLAGLTLALSALLSLSLLGGLGLSPLMGP